MREAKRRSNLVFQPRDCHDRPSRPRNDRQGSHREKRSDEAISFFPLFNPGIATPKIWARNDRQGSHREERSDAAISLFNPEIATTGKAGLAMTGGVVIARSEATKQSYFSSSKIATTGKAGLAMTGRVVIARSEATKQSRYFNPEIATPSVAGFAMTTRGERRARNDRNMSAFAQQKRGGYFSPPRYPKLFFVKPTVCSCACAQTAGSALECRAPPWSARCSSAPG